MPTLTVVAVRDVGQQGLRRELGEDEIWLGRAPENDLALSDERMSRRHARVCKRGGGYVLVDCGSLTGSYVNGERVAGERLLRHGDRIQLGRTELAFEDPASAPRIACTACGATIDADARFCPACGESPAAMPPAPDVIPKTVFRPAVDEPRAALAEAPAAVVRVPETPAAAPAVLAGRPRRSWGGLVALLAIVVLVGAGLGGTWWWRRNAGGQDAGKPAINAVGLATGVVSLPPSIAVTGLRVLAPSDDSPLDGSSRRFRVTAAPVGGQPAFLALASAANRPLLLGEAGSDLSARSTALALVLLDPEVARRGAAARGAVRGRAHADPRLAELSRLVEQALLERPADPLGSDASDGIYRLAAAITRDALGALEAKPGGHTQHAAAQTAGGPMIEEFGAPGRDFLSRRAAAARGPTAGTSGPSPLSVEDDSGHKTDEVVVINGTFSYYRVTVTRDGTELADLKRVLLMRNKPHTFLHLAWPPVGKFETRRPLPAGNGKLVFSFEKDKDLTIIDILLSAVATPLGTSGMPQLNAEEDIRVLLATLGQASAVVRDFKVMCERFRTYGTPAEAAQALATFFATRGTTIALAFAPLLKQQFKEHYIQALGYSISKKLVFAITAGYAGTDILAAIWSLSRQPDQLTVTGEQRYGVWPPIDLTVKVREKPTAAGGAPGRLFAVAAQLAGVPEEFTSLELRFSYPGDPGEDKEELQPKVGLLAARDHRFIQATEAVVAAHLPDGKLVAKGASTLSAALTSSDTFEFERAGWSGTGRITIVGKKIDGRHTGTHKLAPHQTELSLEGTFDPETQKGSGTIRGGDTMRALRRVFKTAWEGTFEAELKGDRLEIRFNGKFTQGSGPFSTGMRLPPATIVARGVKVSP